VPSICRVPSSARLGHCGRGAPTSKKIAAALDFPKIVPIALTRVLPVWSSISGRANDFACADGAEPRHYPVWAGVARLRSAG
jgi:hypothetical protein